MKINNKYIVSILGNKDNIESIICFYSLEDGRTRLINRRFINKKLLGSIDFLDDSALYIITNYCDDVDYLYEDSLLDEDSRNRLKKVNDDTNALIFKYYLKEDIL